MTNQVSQIDEESSSWLTPIMHYLSSGGLPDNRIEAHKIQVHVARFSLVNGQLYKRSLDMPYLKCLITWQDSIYWSNFMRGYAEIIQVVELYLIRPIHKVIIGQP